MREEISTCPLIELRYVYANYGNTEVLKNISFNVFSGEAISILGENGSGKTTLIKTIAGLLDYSGDIFLNGNNLKTLKRKTIAKQIAVLSQISSVYFSYSVYETVMLGQYAQTKNKAFTQISKYDKEYVDRCLNAVGIFELLNRQINTLSGGQLQRVYLARTLADEPTNHLDLKHQIDLINFLQELIKSENKTVIGVFHDVNLAMKFANKILFLKNGELKSFGKKEEVATSQMFKDVYGIDVVAWQKETLNQWNSTCFNN